LADTNSTLVLVGALDSTFGCSSCGPRTSGREKLDINLEGLGDVDFDVGIAVDLQVSVGWSSNAWVQRNQGNVEADGVTTSAVLDRVGNGNNDNGVGGSQCVGGLGGIQAGCSCGGSGVAVGRNRGGNLVNSCITRTSCYRWSGASAYGAVGQSVARGDRASNREERGIEGTSQAGLDAKWCDGASTILFVYNNALCEVTVAGIGDVTSIVGDTVIRYAVSIGVGFQTASSDQSGYGSGRSSRGSSGNFDLSRQANCGG